MNVMVQVAKDRETRGASLLVTHTSPELLMATYDRVCIAIWETKPRAQLFEIQRSHLESVVLRYPERACFVCVVSPRTDPPEQEIRDASSKMMSAHGKRLAGCACVIEGSGFRAAMTRTVLAGIMLVVKMPSPVSFFESVPSAARWLETKICHHSLTGLPEQLKQARMDMRG